MLLAVEPLSKLAILVGDNKWLSNKASFENHNEEYEHAHRFGGERYPKEISRRMLTTSFILTIPALYSVYYECYFLAVGMWMVVLCSINYWRKPVDGMRKVVDVTASRIVIILHYLYGISYVDWATAIVFALQIVGCGIFYILAELCRRRDYLNLSSYFHCSMHIWVSLCNPWVYYQICIQRV